MNETGEQFYFILFLLEMDTGSIKQSRSHRAAQFAKGQNTEEVAASCLAPRPFFSSLAGGVEEQGCKIPGCCGLGHPATHTETC